MLKTKRKLIIIDFEDIDYIIKNNRKMEVYLDGDTYSYYENINNIDMPEYFISLNKHCFINANRVKVIDYDKIVFRDGNFLYYCKNFKRNFKEEIINFYR